MRLVLTLTTFVLCCCTAVAKDTRCHLEDLSNTTNIILVRSYRTDSSSASKEIVDVYI